MPTCPNIESGDMFNMASIPASTRDRAALEVGRGRVADNVVVVTQPDQRQRFALQSARCFTEIARWPTKPFQKGEGNACSRDAHARARTGVKTPSAGRYRACPACVSGGDDAIGCASRRKPRR